MSWLSSYFKSRLRKPISTTQISPATAQKPSATSTMRPIRLADLDDLFAEAQEVGGPESIAMLSEYYLELELGEVPADPTTDEYSQFVMDLYTRLSGRSAYDPLIDERKRTVKCVLTGGLFSWI